MHAQNVAFINDTVIHLLKFGIGRPDYEEVALHIVFVEDIEYLGCIGARAVIECQIDLFRPCGSGTFARALPVNCPNIYERQFITDRAYGA